MSQPDPTGRLATKASRPKRLWMRTDETDWVPIDVHDEVADERDRLRAAVEKYLHELTTYGESNMRILEEALRDA